MLIYVIMMWWLLLNFNQLVLLWAAYTSMLPIRVNLDPIYEFIILGVVPGTAHELDFIAILSAIAMLLFSILVARTDFTIQHTQNN